MSLLQPLPTAAMGLLLGAVAGSFSAAILVRWPQQRSVVTGRSSCDSCQRTLGPFDLIPIISFLLRKGRCRYCKEKIDKRHLPMEIAAAFVGLVSFIHSSEMGIATAILGWWLLLLAALDLQHRWLPDRLTLPLLGAGLAAALLAVGPSLEDRLFGAAAGYLLLLGAGLVYQRLRGRQGLGGGDPKMVAAIGAWLGWQPLPFLLAGAGLIGLTAVLLARLRGSAVSATDELPLGAYLAVAAWPLWLLRS